MNKLYLFVLFIVSINFIQGQISQDSLILSAKFHSQGYDLMVDGQYKEAIRFFDKAIGINTSNANYFHNRAFCNNTIGNAKEALNDYEDAIKLNPDNYEYYYLAGNIQQEMMDFEKAIDSYSEALRLIGTSQNPDSYIILFNRGNCYLKSDNYILALSDYNLSSKMNPAHYATYANRGIAKYKLDDKQGGCYDWYIAKNNEIPYSSEYYEKYCQGIDFSDSIYTFKESQTEIADEIVTINLTLNDLINVPEIYNAADIETIPEFNSDDQGRNKYINEIIKYPQLARERGIQGIVFITFIVEQDGSITNIEVLKGIGGGCDEEAKRVIENMPKWVPGYKDGKPVRVRINIPILFSLEGSATNTIISDNNFNRGLKNLSDGYYITASKYFSKSIKKNGSMFKEAYANRAICKYKLDDFEGAIEDLEIAKSFHLPKINKVIASVYLNMGNDYWELKDYEKSIDYFSKGIKANPNDAEIFLNRGIAYYYLGHKEKACKDWKKARKYGLKDAEELIEERCK